MDEATPTQEQDHSRLGIWSFGISITVGVLLVVMFGVAAVLVKQPHVGPYPGQTAIGISAISLMFADVLAVGLGIGSFFEKGKKKIFGVLGLSFSALTIMGTIALIIIGLMFRHSAS